MKRTSVRPGQLLYGVFLKTGSLEEGRTIVIRVKIREVIYPTVEDKRPQVILERLDSGIGVYEHIAEISMWPLNELLEHFFENEKDATEHALSLSEAYRKQMRIKANAEQKRDFKLKAKREELAKAQALRKTQEAELKALDDEVKAKEEAAEKDKQMKEEAEKEAEVVTLKSKLEAAEDRYNKVIADYQVTIKEWQTRQERLRKQLDEAQLELAKVKKEANKSIWKRIFGG